MKDIISAVAGAVTSSLLGVIVWILRKILLELKGFLDEHAYLLSLGDWTKAGLFLVASKLDVELPLPPVIGKHARGANNGN